MVQPLVIYPDERVNITCTDVRSFNETLDNVLEDMIDTMDKHSLESMAAIQIAYPYNIVLIKNGDSYDEYINPRILKNEDIFDSTETTLYYPDITVTVPRYAKIKLVYEDRKGNPLHIDIDDKKLASTLQRKIDYTFGGNFLDKVSKERREKILDALASNGLIPPPTDVCPTFSKKDYFVSFTDKLLIIMGLTLITPLFSPLPETLNTIYTTDKVLFPAIIILMISFFFYAQYEAKKYSQCSSCQIGNNIGVIVKRVVLAGVFAIASYLLVNPNGILHS